MSTMQSALSALPLSAATFQPRCITHNERDAGKQFLDEYNKMDSPPPPPAPPLLGHLCK